MTVPAPAGYVADPNNPGWHYDATQDVSRPEAWWQEPPDGWTPDPANPGWWYDPSGDAARPECWWHEGRVQEPAAAEDWYAPVFARARELYGRTPYQFGGDRTPGRSAGPWDCIGYVMECLDSATPPLGDLGTGLHQGYINAERARAACSLVQPGAEQPGDLVFFHTTYPTPGASHVGIVLDPARRLMADDHDRGNGTGPGETDYSAPYWRAHFLGFARVPR